VSVVGLFCVCSRSLLCLEKDGVVEEERMREREE
jgi:hypothetical protein